MPPVVKDGASRRMQRNREQRQDTVRWRKGCPPTARYMLYISTTYFLRFVLPTNHPTNIFRPWARVPAIRNSRVGWSSCRSTTSVAAFGGKVDIVLRSGHVR